MFHTVVLALVQSATEFLPVSSSAHLILVPKLMGWADQGLVMDVALHLGTLFAVMLYFKSDIKSMCVGAFQVLGRKGQEKDLRLAMNLVVATIPALLVGFFFNDYIEEVLRSPLVIAFTAIFFGVLLYVADRFGKTQDAVETLSMKKAFLIGVAQMVALIPGVSRSGITMTASRALGVSREESARFSMLLAVPTIGAAASWTALKLFLDPQLAQTTVRSEVIVGVIVAFIGGALAISFLMKWLKTSSFALFAVYRIVLGGVLLYLYL